ncbi:hypothetical protein, partial [Pseudomonas sp. MD195_PC81_125]|uniref:hypothetical protein n=1 Tax=Pseudomonas sp. MD195_PC81_125 TaxID=2741560 RepID=UPI001C71574F
VVLRLSLLLMESVACNTPCGACVALFLNLGQRKQGDRWVKLDETLRSHSPSIEWASAKTTVEAADNAFTGAHPLRSLMGATMCLLAVLRHIRSLARKPRLWQR